MLLTFKYKNHIAAQAKGYDSEYSVSNYVWLGSIMFLPPPRSSATRFKEEEGKNLLYILIFTLLRKSILLSISIIWLLCRMSQGSGIAWERGFAAILYRLQLILIGAYQFCMWLGSWKHQIAGRGVMRKIRNHGVEWYS